MRQHLLFSIAAIGLLIGGGSAFAQDRPVVLAHGLGSDASSWDFAAPRLEQELALTPYRWNTSWRQPYAQQASELEGAMSGLPGTAVMVGHSNGGVISREVSRRRDVGAVVTVDSPNRGAPLSGHINQMVAFSYDGLQKVGNVNTGYRYRGIEWFDRGSNIEGIYWTIQNAWNFAAWVPSWLLFDVIAQIGYSVAFPVMQDMAPWSPYFESRNSPGQLAVETDRTPVRIGIVSTAHNFYLAGPARAAVPDSADTIAAWMYAGAASMDVAAALIFAFSEPSDWAMRDLAADLLRYSFWVYSVDSTWCQLVSYAPEVGHHAACAENDGVVPVWSQLLPGHGAIQLIRNGPAHLQATKNGGYGFLHEALAHDVHIPPRGPEPPQPPPSVDRRVSFQASDGHWMVAEGGGGGVVNANRGGVGAWETFDLVDLNGDEFVDGDAVALVTSNGFYLQAEGGGGPGTAMLAVGGCACAWETFTIVSLEGPGPVMSGDRVGLRSINGYHASAEGGGNDVVVTDRPWLQGWETFRIVFQ